MTARWLPMLALIAGFVGAYLFARGPRRGAPAPTWT
jgi:hypothetical protein